MLVWDAVTMQYRRKHIIMVRDGMPILTEADGIGSTGGRYAHLMRDEEQGTARWLELRKEEWQWDEDGGMAAARTRGWDARARPVIETQERTARVPPANVWDIWVMARDEMRADAEMREQHACMTQALQRAKRLMQAHTLTAGADTRRLRGAWIAMVTGRRGYRAELAAVIGGAWRMENGVRVVRKRTDTERSVDDAIAAVQCAAGRMLVRWHAMSKHARRWAGRQEWGRARMRVVMHEWREVCRRRTGQWRASGRAGRERDMGMESDELTPRWSEEWSYRPGVSAVMPGTVNGWLLAYARTRAQDVRERREPWAAWQVRRTWVPGQDWGALYRDSVRDGKRPVARRGEEMWTRWCEMNKGSAVEVEGVQVRRRGGMVWIAGRDERVVRRVVRAEKDIGERWVIRAGRGRSGEGGEGGWGAAAQWRATAGVRKKPRGRTLRMDAATLVRMLNGLGEPFGDG